MEQHGGVAILNDLSVFLERVDAKVNERPIIVEEDGCRGFLIIAAIARVEDLDANLAVLVGVAWGNSVSR